MEQCAKIKNDIATCSNNDKIVQVYRTLLISIFAFFIFLLVMRISMPLHFIPEIHYIKVVN